jgi:dTDP-4-dehydrorhamnose reductase
MPKVVIFGCMGQLGKDLVKMFQSEYEVAGYDLPELNITNPTEVYRLLDEPTPDLVINAAAYTNVDLAEKEVDHAFLVNEIGARLVADLASQWGVPVVYLARTMCLMECHETLSRRDTPLSFVRIWSF